MLGIIKYACGSLGKMSGRGTELDLELGREFIVRLAQVQMQEVWVGVTDYREPHGPLFRTR